MLRTENIFLFRLLLSYSQFQLKMRWLHFKPLYILLYMTKFWLKVNMTIIVTLEYKTSLTSLGYICSNSQKYIVWVKIIIFYFDKNHQDIK